MERTAAAFRHFAWTDIRAGCAALALGALVACAPPARAYDFAALDSIMTATPWGANGAALIVQRDTTVIYESAVAPMTFTRVIPIASSSKWLSAAAFMTLVDDGSLALDDPV